MIGGETGDPIDFSSWCVMDPDRKLEIIKLKVLWTRANRASYRHVYQNQDEKPIGNFKHQMDVRIHECYAASKTHLGLLRLWECRNDWHNRLWVYVRRAADSPYNWTIHFEQLDDAFDSWEFHGTHRFALQEAYTVKISRVGSKCRLYVLPYLLNAPRLEDSGEIECSDVKYRSIWICSTLKTRWNRMNWSSGSIENLILG